MTDDSAIEQKQTIPTSPPEPKPWQTRLVVLRISYFLLGFWCGVIAILLILITISALYGFS